MKRKVLVFVALLVLTIFTIGCSGGSDGAPGATGPAGTVDPAAVTDAADAAVALASITPESCAVCHAGAGAEHQAVYDGVYQDNKIQVTDITYAYAAGTTTVTFKMAGVVTDCTAADNLNIYFAEYNGTGFSGAPRKSLKPGSTTGTIASAGGVCTSTYTPTVANDPGNLSAKNGILVVYGYEENILGGSTNIGTSRVKVPKYPYAGVKVMNAVGYASAASVAGCEKCHTIPYLKHGNIYGEAGKIGAGKDFYTCKVCHLDDGEGGHLDWQVLVDNPLRYTQIATTPLTDAEKVQYAYKTTLMNDVHMSHAMEFPYPQSMSNCVVCHSGTGQIATITADAKFVATTCKSCHPVTGPAEGTGSKRAPALKAIWEAGNVAWHTIDMTCNTSGCHAAGGNGKVLSKIHNGYDKKIYAEAGKKYSDVFKVNIDSVSIAGTDLTIKFSATKGTTTSTLKVTDISPKVVVGLYGWDTKDFIVDAHGSDFDDNGDGKIATRNCGAACDYRNLEYDWGTATPRFTAVSAANGQWEVKAHLAAWGGLITDKTVKRIGIAVLPILKDADGDNVPVDSPAKTFDIATNKLVTYFSPIVNVTGGCNNCHEALGRTFHSAQYGNAGVVGCRFCHTPRSGGSHLEMQSRSIDSYVHAIHSFQPFDIGDIDFTDAVEAMHYDHHIEFLYPTFLVQNCKSCHVADKFEVPDQAKSLGGTLSAADTVAGRSIGAVPSYITGPGSRACGSCHRSVMINEDAAGELASFNQHVKTFGYLKEATDSTVFDTVINKIMKAFK